MPETVRDAITREDFYKIHGLMALANEHVRELQVIERALAGLVGEEGDGSNYFGYVSDEVWTASGSATDILRAYKLEVEDVD